MTREAHLAKFFIGTALSLVLLAGCAPATAPTAGGDSAPQASSAAQQHVSKFDAAKLASVLADPRRDKDRARDGIRHTTATMAFFDVGPSDNVVEVLPGGGWYSRVLLPYVSPDGGWYGLNYSVELTEHFYTMRGMTMDEDARTKTASWPQTYLTRAATNGPEGAKVAGAFLFDAIPEENKGKMDAILFIRALHHLNRFDPAIFERAITDSYDLLKPGGIVGVVQHRAKDDYGTKTYDVSGNMGYMQQSYVIEMFEKGGFVLEESSEMNANPKDTADYEIGVWTLPPSLRGKGESMKDHYREIGESDRMTLRFRKKA